MKKGCIVVVLLIFLLSGVSMFLMGYTMDKGQYYTNIQPSSYFFSNPNVLDFDKKVTIDKGVIIIPMLNDREISLGRLANTGSMRPALSDTSRVLLIKPLSESELHVGDIVSIKYTSEGNLIHRIIKIEKINGVTTYITKGDNNDIDDVSANAFNHPVTFSDIDGKVVGVLY